ncbi:DGQHR domain-containing protein [Limnothrix redekei]|uniref:DGQHR domain-containing protein n=1 Tax=Limnothrix redekei LRLZ20PSL1 TaxID=3112953 RepID=A0ABW7CDZ5_9CYAN
MSMVELKNILKVEDPSGRVYYLGTLKPLEIKQLTFVPVVSGTEEPTEDSSESLNSKAGGYQRAGDSKRMRDIKRFILDRPSCLIPPVLLCARGKWSFTPQSNSTKNFGTIQASDLAAIIDGQHRLGGLWKLAIDQEVDETVKSRPIPFMAIDDMQEDEEKQEFVDINGNQKGVKKSLLVYLDREGDFASKVADALREDEESVFRGRIGLEKRHDWQLILFGAAKECVDLMFSKNFTVTKDFNPKDDLKLQASAISFVLSYWKAVKSSMHEYWSDIDKMPAIDAKKSPDKPGTSGFQYRLLEETGIRAFSKLAAKLFSARWMASSKAPSFDSITSDLESLAKRDRVKLVLTKPKFNAEVLKLNSDLKSTGKAGVEAIYLYLEAECDQIIQGN